METIFNQVNFLTIYNRVVNVKPNAKRRWGKMNVVQMSNHLKIATGSGLMIYHLKDESTFFSRKVKTYIALRLLKKFPKNVAGPEGFKTELNRALDFDTEMDQALNMLKKAHSSTYKVYPHPMFGPLTRELWGRLIYRHYDHHLRQFGY